MKKLVTYQNPYYSVLCNDGKMYLFSESYITNCFFRISPRELVINNILKMRVICKDNYPFIISTNKHNHSRVNDINGISCVGLKTIHSINYCLLKMDYKGDACK
jgi:hypothetical protein